MLSARVALVWFYAAMAAALVAAETPPRNARGHWAFSPPQRPPVPVPHGGGSSHNPVDAFLAAAREGTGVCATAEEGRDLWLRRVTIDLTGLPPTLDALRAFRGDPSVDAEERVVDRLLASPRYGERWARHWMDVWRYSDWFGLGKEVRFSHPHIWHWRDWIVESLNADKGYDRMVIEMLAGDEIAPQDPDTLRATGFLARNWYIFNRNTLLDDVVEHTSRGFLGITLQCARCHDHKYDPFSQADYYRLRAFFEPHHVRIDRLPGDADRTKAGLVRVYDAFLDLPTYLFERGDEMLPVKTEPLAPAVPLSLGGGPIAISLVPLPGESYCPDKREFVVRETLASARDAVTQALAARDKAGASGPVQLEIEDARVAATEAQLQSLEAVLAVERSEEENGARDAAWEALALAASKAQRRAATLEAKAAQLSAAKQASEATSEKLEEARKRLAAAAETLAKAETIAQEPLTTSYAPRALTYPRAATRYNEVPPNEPYPKVSSGRRTALARWITAPANPLAARVAVNHIWARHFGEPLVGSMFDFGVRTPRPRHQALLDWLAVELVESGWSMKRLHRLLVLSQTYRLRSSDGADRESARRDDDNRFFWRMNPRRMEAEVIRDSLLALAGRSDFVLGGPDRPVAEADSTGRRTLYYRYARDDRILALTLFDAPSVQECYRRHETIVPQQALALLNSKLVLTCSGEIAALIDRDLAVAGDVEAPLAFIESAFERILARPPSTVEREESLRALDELRSLAAAEKDPAPESHARAAFVHVLLNHNDFITVR